MSLDETSVVWSEEYGIGVEKIDQEHQELFDVLRWMLIMVKSDDVDPFTCADGVMYFVNYASQHFAHEEEYMRSIHYKDYEKHKELHDKVAAESMPPMLKELEESGYSAESMRNFLGFWTGWLTGHILVDDLAIRQEQEE